MVMHPRLAHVAVVMLVATAAAAGQACEEASIQSDETPLLQVHAAKGEAMKRQNKPPMPVNGPGVPPSDTPPTLAGTTNVDVHNTVVVITGPVAVGQNVSLGSGNTRTTNTNVTTELQALLKEVTETAADSAAATAAKSVKEIEKGKIALPRFITDGQKIWLQNDVGKHVLVADPSGNCSPCGCFFDVDGTPYKYGNYADVTAEELADMPDGDQFSCEKYMPPLSMLQNMGVLFTREGLRAAHERAAR